MIHIMTDIKGMIWYIDPAQFWFYRNREKKKNKIIKGLIEVINDMISIEELNLLAFLYIPID